MDPNVTMAPAPIAMTSQATKVTSLLPFAAMYQQQQMAYNNIMMKQSHYIMRNHCDQGPRNNSISSSGCSSLSPGNSEPQLSPISPKIIGGIRRTSSPAESSPKLRSAGSKGGSYLDDSAEKSSKSTSSNDVISPPQDADEHR